MSTYKKHYIRDLERQKIVLKDKLEFTNNEAIRNDIEGQIYDIDHSINILNKAELCTGEKQTG
jgi:hypothetical protein